MNALQDPKDARRAASQRPPPSRPGKRSVTVSILAGGLSSRMGREKARLRLGPRTLLGHARDLARQLGLPVRVIRRDLVPRCGPLGGVLTALRTRRTDVDVFLACDMPFVTTALLRKLLSRLRGGCRAAFTDVGGVAGFPFALDSGCLPVVERQIRAKALSLQSFAGKLKAARVSPGTDPAEQTFNVNTPAELRAARARFR